MSTNSPRRFSALDGFEAECITFVAAEAVCLVDEEYAADGTLDSGLDQLGRLADVFADEIVAGDLYELTDRQCAERFEGVGEYARDSGLACAGIAEELVV